MSTKHAFLIGCYQYPEYLAEFINSLDGDRSNFYIHINRKNLAEFSSFIQSMSKRKNVHIVQSIDVNWGGMGFLLSAKQMIKDALDNEENEFFHLLSGQDALCRPIQSLYDFFDQNKESNYVDKSIDITTNPNILKWIKFYHWHDILNVRESTFAKIVEKSSAILQNLFFINRTLPYKTVYKGFGWFSLNRKGISVLFEAMSNQKFLNKWKYSFATEELFIHSVLRNYSGELNLVYNNYRYSYWDFNKKLFPATLDESYYNEIINSNAFFCRKINPKTSRELLKKLGTHISSL